MVTGLGFNPPWKADHKASALLKVSVSRAPESMWPLRREMAQGVWKPAGTRLPVALGSESSTKAGGQLMCSCIHKKKKAL